MGHRVRKLFYTNGRWYNGKITAQRDDDTWGVVYNILYDDDDTEAGAYTRQLFSSTWAVSVTPPRVPLSNRLGENHAPNVSHKMCLR